MKSRLAEELSEQGQLDCGRLTELGRRSDLMRLGQIEYFTSRLFVESQQT